MVNKFLWNMFQKHQIIKMQRLIEEGMAIDEIVHVLQDDNRFFFKEVIKGKRNRNEFTK